MNLDFFDIGKMFDKQESLDEDVKKFTNELRGALYEESDEYLVLDVESKCAIILNTRNQKVEEVNREKLPLELEKNCVLKKCNEKFILCESNDRVGEKEDNVIKEKRACSSVDDMAKDAEGELFVDRIEGEFAVCYNSVTMKMEDIPLKELHNDIHDGAKIRYKR